MNYRSCSVLLTNTEETEYMHTFKMQDRETEMEKDRNNNLNKKNSFNQLNYVQSVGQPQYCLICGCV